MKLLNKTALGLIVAATAFTGLAATPAAAHDRRGDYGYGYSDRGGWYGDRYDRYDRYDRHRDRYWEHRRREWRERQWRRHHDDWHDRDRYDNDWRHNRRDGRWDY